MANLKQQIEACRDAIINIPEVAAHQIELLHGNLKTQFCCENVTFMESMGQLQ